MAKKDGINTRYSSNYDKNERSRLCFSKTWDRHQQHPTQFLISRVFKDSR